MTDRPKFDVSAVRERIVRVARHERKLSGAAAHDVGFHMTDWSGDLEVFLQFCENPGLMTDEEVDRMLGGFLFHVPNHLAAAGKLFNGWPVTDVFGVGAAVGKLRRRSWYRKKRK